MTETVKVLTRTPNNQSGLLRQPGNPNASRQGSYPPYTFPGPVSREHARQYNREAIILRPFQQMHHARMQFMFLDNGTMLPEGMLPTKQQVTAKMQQEIGARYGWGDLQKVVQHEQIANSKHATREAWAQDFRGYVERMLKQYPNSAPILSALGINVDDISQEHFASIIGTHTEQGIVPGFADDPRKFAEVLAQLNPNTTDIRLVSVLAQSLYGKEAGQFVAQAIDQERNLRMEIGDKTEPAALEKIYARATDAMLKKAEKSTPEEKQLIEWLRERVAQLNATRQAQGGIAQASGPNQAPEVVANSRTSQPATSQTGSTGTAPQPGVSGPAAGTPSPRPGAEFSQSQSVEPQGGAPAPVNAEAITELRKGVDIPNQPITVRPGQVMAEVHGYGRNHESQDVAMTFSGAGYELGIVFDGVSMVPDGSGGSHMATQAEIAQHRTVLQEAAEQLNTEIAQGISFSQAVENMKQWLYQKSGNQAATAAIVLRKNGKVQVVKVEDANIAHVAAESGTAGSVDWYQKVTPESLQHSGVTYPLGPTLPNINARTYDVPDSDRMLLCTDGLFKLFYYGDGLHVLDALLMQLGREKLSPTQFRDALLKAVKNQKLKLLKRGLEPENIDDVGFAVI
ncbi:protein phosphatase 2C domain-containing protein [Candidatus Woesebacteria bacterium]|nr:protein phosphatase 2C domain-containing protein [Candidatus Woesebacteria bacterium]